jgi:hypothetical protein
MAEASTTLQNRVMSKDYRTAKVWRQDGTELSSRNQNSM